MVYSLEFYKRSKNYWPQNLIFFLSLEMEMVTLSHVHMSIWSDVNKSESVQYSEYLGGPHFIIL